MLFTPLPPPSACSKRLAKMISTMRERMSAKMGNRNDNAFKARKLFKMYDEEGSGMVGRWGGGWTGAGRDREGVCKLGDKAALSAGGPMRGRQEPGLCTAATCQWRQLGLRKGAHVEAGRASESLDSDEGGQHRPSGLHHTCLGTIPHLARPGPL